MKKGVFILILIDWVSFTIKGKTLDEIIGKVLQIEKENFTKLESGKMGYKERLMYNNIEILYEGKPDMGIHIIISGKGCRYYESHNNIVNLITRLKVIEGKITRIDLAYDLVNYKDDILENMIYSIRNNLVISKWRTNTLIEKRENKTSDLIGRTVNFGSRSSEIFLRVYDKKKQLKADVKNYVRLELEIKGEKAEELETRIVENQGNLFFYEILNNYIRFLDNSRTNDKNKSRWPVADWWLDLLETTKSIKLSAKPEKRTIEDMEEWLEKQVATTIATLAIAKGGEVDFLYDLIKSGRKRMKPKHHEAIRGSQNV